MPRDDYLPLDRLRQVEEDINAAREDRVSLSGDLGRHEHQFARLYERVSELERLVRELDSRNQDLTQRLDAADARRTELGGSGSVSALTRRDIEQLRAVEDRHAAEVGRAAREALEAHQRRMFTRTEAERVAAEHGLDRSAVEYITALALDRGAAPEEIAQSLDARFALREWDQRGQQLVDPDSAAAYPSGSSLSESCDECDGTGEVDCDECGETESVYCMWCDEAGRMPCPECDGTGWVDSEEPEHQESGEAMPQEQIELLPEDRPQGELMQIPLEDIEPSTGHDPNGLTESIRRLGVLQPVVLVRSRQRRSGANPWLYSIAEGRRRVAAVRQLGDEGLEDQPLPEDDLVDALDAMGADDLDTIPALVFPHGTPPRLAAAIALSTNLHRSSNVLNEFEEIQRLVHEGYPEEDIAHELRIPVQTVRSRMRLGALIEPLRERLRNREMSPSTATAAARLGRELQERIAHATIDEDRVTARHVRDARQARDEQAATPDIFQNPETVGSSQAVGGGATLEAEPVPAERGEVVASVNGERIQVELVLPESMEDVPNGWEFVVAYLTAAEMAIPANPDDDTDWVFQTLSELRERVDQIAGVSAD